MKDSKTIIKKLQTFQKEIEALSLKVRRQILESEIANAKAEIKSGKIKEIKDVKSFMKKFKTNV
jgi:hypothetical protein